MCCTNEKLASIENQDSLLSCFIAPQTLIINKGGILELTIIQRNVALLRGQMVVVYRTEGIVNLTEPQSLCQAH